MIEEDASGDEWVKLEKLNRFTVHSVLLACAELTSVFYSRRDSFSRRMIVAKVPNSLFSCNGMK